MPRHRVTWVVVCLMFLLLLGTVSCGGQAKGVVSGKVKYKGKLLNSGQVAFYDSNDRQLDSASISTDGSYSAKLPTGLMRIAVSVPLHQDFQSLPLAKKKKAREFARKVNKEKEGTDPFGGENKGPSVTIPTKYADPVHSGISVTVTGGSQSFDIDLE